jgi:two-component system LytT family response regulator
MDGLGKGKLTNKSLREWEERLPQSHFCRIHRFSIVNIEYIENIEPWHNYSHRVYIKGVEKPLLMSRRYFSIIKEKLG